MSILTKCHNRIWVEQVSLSLNYCFDGQLAEDATHVHIFLRKTFNEYLQVHVSHAHGIFCLVLGLSDLNHPVGTFIPFVCAPHPRRAGGSWFISHMYTSVLLSLVEGTHSAHWHANTHTQPDTHTLNFSVCCSAGADEQACSLLPSPPHLLVIRVPLRQTGSICRVLSTDQSLPLFLSPSLPCHCVALPLTMEWWDNAIVALQSWSWCNPLQMLHMEYPWKLSDFYQMKWHVG